MNRLQFCRRNILNRLRREVYEILRELEADSGSIAIQLSRLHAVTWQFEVSRPSRRGMLRRNKRP